jgi:hypothetical protein
MVDIFFYMTVMKIRIERLDSSVHSVQYTLLNFLIFEKSD